MKNVMLLAALLLGGSWVELRADSEMRERSIEVTGLKQAQSLMAFLDYLTNQLEERGVVYQRESERRRFLITAKLSEGLTDEAFEAILKAYVPKSGRILSFKKIENGFSLRIEG